MNKENLNEHLKILGSGVAVLVGIFLAIYFIPYVTIMLIVLTFFLGLAYAIGYMIRDVNKELKNHGSRNRKSL